MARVTRMFRLCQETHQRPFGNVLFSKLSKWPGPSSRTVKFQEGKAPIKIKYKYIFPCDNFFAVVL